MLRNTEEYKAKSEKLLSDKKTYMLLKKDPMKEYTNREITLGVPTSVRRHKIGF